MLPIINRYIYRNCRKLLKLTTFNRTNLELITFSAKMSNRSDCEDIVWMDMEMSGLDVRKDKIMEVACFITDKNLNIRGNSLTVHIKHPDEVYENMNEWCVEQHTKSGLVDQCKKFGVSTEAAESMLLKYLQNEIPKGQCPLAGNSVYMDRLFLMFHMPTIHDYLHYRLIDVSSVKECFKRWCPNKVLEMAPKKNGLHRGIDDIKESRDELEFYKKQLFDSIQ